MINFPDFLLTLALFAFLFFVVACTSKQEITSFTGNYIVKQHTGKMKMPDTVECWSNGEYYYLSGIDGRWRLETRNNRNFLVSDYMEILDVDSRIWFGTGIWDATSGLIKFDLTSIVYETKFDKDADTGQDISWHTQYEKNGHFVLRMIKTEN